MRNRLLFVLSFIILTVDCFSQVDCEIYSKSFASGEKISYQLYYNLGFIWINAGNCDFEVRSVKWNNKPVYKLSAIGKSNSTFESLFLVRDTLISYAERESLIPYRALKLAHEGRWSGTDDISFTREKSGWNVITRLKRRGEWKEPVEDFSENCGFDILTSIYRLRCMNDSEVFVKDKITTIPLRLDDGEYKVSLKYLGKQNIKLHGNGTYKSHAFTLTLVQGNVFGSGGIMNLWISDDRNKIPLLVESPLRVGKVKAIFRTSEKTLYPLSQPLKR